MQLAGKNVLVLAVCQALLVANNSTLIAIGGLAGYALADNKSFATLTVTAWVSGTALAALPMSLLMKRVGRRLGFYFGALLGAAGAGLGALAIYLGSFWLLCLGMLACGAYNGAAQFYRFAVADAAPVDFKARAISLVLVGGLVGGLIGPEISKFSVDLFSAKFLGGYVFLLAYLALVMLALAFLRIPPPSEVEQQGSGRPLSEILLQPATLVAIVGAAGGYGVMNFLMVATPIAMGQHGHGYHDAAFVIEWHVIAMFAPSLFTGDLIKRYGAANILIAGALAMSACVVAALTGLAVMNFWVALVLLGLGWNFLYVGGTALLTETYRPTERAKVQGVNDLTIFLVQAVTSLISGWVLERHGWVTVNYLAVPLIVVMALAAFWLKARRPVAAV